MAEFRIELNEVDKAKPCPIVVFDLFNRLVHTIHIAYGMNGFGNASHIEDI